MHPECGMDVATVNQLQTSVCLPRPHPHGADHTLPIPMSGTGAKPKAGVSVKLASDMESGW